jgi:acetyl-CoA acyltransferase
MSNAAVVDLVRSPMGRGKQGGVLSRVHPVDLLAQLLTALVERNGIDPGTRPNRIDTASIQTAEGQ